MYALLKLVMDWLFGGQDYNTVTCTIFIILYYDLSFIHSSPEMYVNSTKLKLSTHYLQYIRILQITWSQMGVA